MYYELDGEGPPLVLIGGLASKISETEWLTRAMARSNRVLAFDNRGAGRTDKPDAPYSIPMMAGDTDGLMGTLGIRQATILGVSMGGRIALELALSHPDRVSQLILVSTMAAARTPETSTRMGLLTMFAGELFQGRQLQAFRHQRQASAEYDCTDRTRSDPRPDDHPPRAARQGHAAPYGRGHAFGYRGFSDDHLSRRPHVLHVPRAEMVSRHSGLSAAVPMRSVSPR